MNPHLSSVIHAEKILNNILQSILGTVFCCFILFLVFCCGGTYVTKQRSPQHLSYKTTERQNGTSHMTPGTSVTWQHNGTVLEYTEQQNL